MRKFQFLFIILFHCNWGWLSHEIKGSLEPTHSCYALWATNLMKTLNYQIVCPICTKYNYKMYIAQNSLGIKSVESTTAAWSPLWCFCFSFASWNMFAVAFSSLHSGSFFPFVDKLWWLRCVVLWTKRYRVWGWVFESHPSRRKMSFTSKWALLGLRRHFGKDSSSPRSTLHTKCPLRNIFARNFWVSQAKWIFSC